jgi:hypothetical protein
MGRSVLASFLCLKLLHEYVLNLTINVQHGNAQAAVWHDFWVC